MNWIKKIKSRHSISRWVSLFFLLVFVFVFLYLLYRAEIMLGRHPLTYVVYYIILSVGTIFWGIVYYIQEKHRLNAIVMGISLLVGAYLVEGFLYFIRPNNSADMAKKLGVYFDTRTKYEVLKDIRKKDKQATLSVFPSMFLYQNKITHNNEQILPLGGISKSTTILCNESGKYAIYRSDRYGFNNDDKQWNNKTIDWLLLGDSFTHGACVSQKETMAGQIIDITGNSAISLGMVGNSLMTELASLKEYGESLCPKNVLWLYTEGNDLSELYAERKSPILMKYLKNNFSQNLISKQKTIDYLENKYISKKIAEYKPTKSLYLGQQSIREFLSLYYIREMIVYYTGTANREDIPKIFPKILKQAKNITKACGSNLYFVYLPAFEGYKYKVDHDRFLRKKEVINLVKDLDIPIIDIHKEVFEKEDNPLDMFAFGIHNHYNAYGYKKVVRAIMLSVKNYEK